MQVWLHEEGPPIWFLGEPKDLIVTLTLNEPGPVELDFESLNDQQKARVIQSLNTLQIESDVSVSELQNREQKQNQKKEDMAADINLAVVERLQKEKEKADQIRKEKEEKLLERCKYIMDKPVRAIKSALKNEKDMKLFDKLFTLEQQGKNRKMVLRWLQEKRVFLAKEQTKKIDKEVQKAMKKEKTYKENANGQTIGFNVIESDSETVVLSPNDLVNITLKEAGGE